MSKDVALPRLTLTERKRRDIIVACIAEFRDHGFGSARIERIAERAGVSKRTLYKHFASKEQMFDVIAVEAMSPLKIDEAVVLDPGLPLARQMGDLLERYMAIVSGDDYVTLSRLLVAEFIADPARARVARQRDDAVRGPIEELIAQAIGHELIREVDPAYATEQLTGMLKAFLFWPRFLGGYPPVAQSKARQIVDDCVKMFLAYYATVDPPAA